MISWMQKNNKFLIVTIWIATISFIFTGATYGFSFGVKSNSIGQVGSIELGRDRFQMEYQNIYSRYNQMFQGKFDEEQANKMGLQEQVLNSMAAQAKILNLAKEFGIIVTDNEVADELASVPSFQKDGTFERTIYDNYIKNSGLSAKTFESSLRDSMTIEKTFSMLSSKSLENEYRAFSTAFEIADKLNYVVLSEDDVNITIDESKLKAFWEVRKEQYQTTKQYTFDVVWTETKDINVTDAEITEYFEKNSFKYTDKEEKRLPLNEVKDWVTDDVRLQKSKKSANKRYIAFKKGKVEKDETLTYDVNDFRLSAELWSEIAKKAKGDLLKPKVVNKRYASLKIVEIKEPMTKSFEKAKDMITALYKNDLSKEALAKLAESKLTNIESEKMEISEFLTLKNVDKQILGLNKQESSNFGSKLFTSEEENGIIPIGSKVIVYKIVEQKLITLDKNDTDGLHQNVDKVKMQAFESRLMQQLDKKYPTEFYK